MIGFGSVNKLDPKLDKIWVRGVVHPRRRECPGPAHALLGGSNSGVAVPPGFIQFRCSSTPGFIQFRCSSTPGFIQFRCSSTPGFIPKNEHVVQKYPNPSPTSMVNAAHSADQTDFLAWFSTIAWSDYGPVAGCGDHCEPSGGGSRDRILE